MTKNNSPLIKIVSTIKTGDFIFEVSQLKETGTGEPLLDIKSVDTEDLGSISRAEMKELLPYFQSWANGSDFGVIEQPQVLFSPNLLKRLRLLQEDITRIDTLDRDDAYDAALGLDNTIIKEVIAILEKI